MPAALIPREVLFANPSKSKDYLAGRGQGRLLGARRRRAQRLGPARRRRRPVGNLGQRSGHLVILLGDFPTGLRSAN